MNKNGGYPPYFGANRQFGYCKILVKSGKQKHIVFSKNNSYLARNTPPPTLTNKHRQCRQVGQYWVLHPRLRQQSPLSWHQSPLTNAYLGLAWSSLYVFSHYWKKVQHMRWFPCYLRDVNLKDHAQHSLGPWDKNSLNGPPQVGGGRLWCARKWQSEDLPWGRRCVNWCGSEQGGGRVEVTGVFNWSSPRSKTLIIIERLPSSQMSCYS